MIVVIIAPTAILLKRKDFPLNRVNMIVIRTGHNNRQASQRKNAAIVTVNKDANAGRKLFVRTQKIRSATDRQYSDRQSELFQFDRFIPRNGGKYNKNKRSKTDLFDLEYTENENTAAQIK